MRIIWGQCDVQLRVYLPHINNRARCAHPPSVVVSGDLCVFSPGSGKCHFSECLLYVIHCLRIILTSVNFCQRFPFSQSPVVLRNTCKKLRLSLCSGTRASRTPPSHSELQQQHVMPFNGAFAGRREEAPITDAEALEVQSQFQVPGLFEHVARGRKRAVGAMFPHLEFTQPR